MNMILSLPRKTDKKCAMEVARQFMKKQFKDNHSYVMAGHDDTDQYHIHVIVKSQGHDGKQLNISKRDLQEWRINYATKARELGVQVDASPRYARGLGARRLTTAVHVMRERGQLLDIDLKYKIDAKNSINIGNVKQTENERAMLDRNKNERVEYARAGMRAADEALKTNDDALRSVLTRSAVMLSKFAMELPVPKARKTVIIENIIGQALHPATPDLEKIKPIISKTARKTTKASMSIKEHGLKIKTAQEVLTFVDMVRKIQETSQTKAIKPDIER
jgi:hypothetical protein